MALIDLISKDVVKVPLESKTKTEIVRELLKVLKDAGKLENLEKAYDAIMARERLGSTGLEDGIAVPHAKTDVVDTLTLAIGISPGGVDFEAIDGKPSQLFFLMLAPPGQSGPHIEALSEIARLTKSKAFCRTLIEARSADEVVEIFRED
ncbi:MAG: PTS sugar transporter subunit IIA [Spirochaetes bacterium]|nr:MAG: PTS sugar transporter subunit IIA [Spirochaetota bacterium]